MLDQRNSSWTAIAQKSRNFFSLLSVSFLKKIARFALFLCVGFIIILYVITPLLCASALKVRAQKFVSEQSDFFKVEKIDASFFPSPTLHFKNVTLLTENSLKIKSLEIAHAKASISWWDCITGQLVFRNWSARNVKVFVTNHNPSFFDPSWKDDSTWKRILGLFYSASEIYLTKLSIGIEDGARLTDDLNLHVTGLSRSFPIEVKIKGKLGSTKENFLFSGKLWLDRLRPQQSKVVTLFKLKQAEMAEIWTFLSPLTDYTVRSGIVTLEGQCRSRGDLRTLRYFGKSRLENFHFLKSHGAGEGQVDLVDTKLDFTYFSKDGRVEFQDTRLESAKSRVDLDGAWRIKPSTEDSDFTLTAVKLDLKEAENAFRPWIELAPFQISVGGQARLNLSLRQKDKLSQLACDLDLQSSHFVWSDLLDKKQGTPMSLSFRWGNRNEKKEWKGDFNVKAKGASLKGSLSEWKGDEKSIHLNLITNKLDLGQLTSFVPWCERHHTRGKVKLLIDRVGKIQPLSEWFKPLYSVNVSFTDFAGIWKTTEFKQVSGYIDVDKKDWEIRGLKWKTDGSQWKLNLVKRQLKNQNDLRFTAQVNVLNLSSYLKDPTKNWFPEPLTRMLRLMGPVDIGKGRVSFEKLVIGESTNERLDIDVDAVGPVFKFPPLSLKAFGGSMSTDIRLNLLSGSPELALDLQANGIKLNSLLDSADFQGDVTFSAHLQGRATTLEEFQASLQGSAQWAIDNGEWKKIHLFKAFSSLPELSGLDEFSSQSTKFTRLDTVFRFSDGKAHFSKSTLKSEDFLLQSEGYLNWDGSLVASVKMTPESYILKKAFKEDYRVGEQLGQYIFTKTQRRPMIIPVVIEV
jgi:uncharacterized membrane protein